MKNNSHNVVEPNDDSRQVPVDVVADSFMRRLRKGERPSISEYTAQYPALAAEIRELFPTLAMLENYGVEEADRLPAAAAETPQEIGDYRIIREVGRGGMGVVYEAEHESMRRRVALKVLRLKSGASETHLRRFYREARAAGRLHHTNIVPVFEVGEHEGTHFYAMQFIQGQNLDAVFEELKQLRAERTGSTTSQPLAETKQIQCGPAAEGEIAQRLHTGKYEQPSVDVWQVAAAETASAGELPDLGKTRRYRDAAPTARISGPLPGPQAPPVLPAVGERSDSHVHRQGYYHRVARIGLQIADALECAHSQGVLHRDIKPSNLILDTAGVVWITDFGLAKDNSDDLTHSGDIVGTLRYMAPERFAGQNDVRSDIYGLGLTLYELCTLQPAFAAADRGALIRQVTQDEPLRPRRLDRRIPRDLETIVLKAIDKQPAQRYQKARQMAEDLRLFLSDRPIRARRVSTGEYVWRWCRRNPQQAALASCVSLLLGLLVVGSLGFGWAMKQQAARLREQAVELTGSRRLATQRAYELSRGRAQAARWSGHRGQHFTSLDDIASARRLLPTLGFAATRVNTEQLGLRNQAIAVLPLPDVREQRHWQTSPAWSQLPTFDLRFARYAVANRDGEISVRRCEDSHELWRLASAGARLAAMRFDSAGRYLAARYTTGRIRAWDLMRGEIVCDVEDLPRLAPFDFGPDETLAYTSRDRLLVMYQLSEPRPERRMRLEVQPRLLRFNPGGSQLAVASVNRLQVYRLNSELPVFSAECSAGVHALAWSPDGEKLVSGHQDGSVWLHHLGVPDAERQLLARHNARVTTLQYNHAGDQLVSDAWDGTIRFWDVSTGRQQLRIDGGRLMATGFSADDRRLGVVLRERFAVWQIARDSPLRVFRSPQPPTMRWSVDIDPASRLLLSAHDGGVELWDLQSSQLLAEIPATQADDGTAKDAKFAAGGNMILTSNRNGLQAWPIELEGGTLRIGPPRIVWPAQTGWLSTNQTGTLAAFRETVNASSFGKVVDLTEAADPVRLAEPHRGIDHVQLSPDGQWLATSSWGGSGLRLWNARTGQPVHQTLEPRRRRLKVAFSPDSRRLAMSSVRDHAVWEVGTWQPVFRKARDSQDNWPGPVAYSADGRILAVAQSRFALKFLDADRGDTIAVLDRRSPAGFHSCTFSADGRLFAAASGKEIHVWDIGLLREQLRQLDLDWGTVRPTPPKAGRETHPLLAVEVVER